MPGPGPAVYHVQVQVHPDPHTIIVPTNATTALQAFNRIRATLRRCDRDAGKATPDLRVLVSELDRQDDAANHQRRR